MVIRKQRILTKKKSLNKRINSGLASKYTSYIAVDPKERNESEESWVKMKSREIHVQVAQHDTRLPMLGGRSMVVRSKPIHTRWRNRSIVHLLATNFDLDLNRNNMTSRKWEPSPGFNFPSIGTPLNHLEEQSYHSCDPTATAAKCIYSIAPTNQHVTE